MVGSGGKIGCEKKKQAWCNLKRARAQGTASKQASHKEPTFFCFFFFSSHARERRRVRESTRDRENGGNEIGGGSGQTCVNWRVWVVGKSNVDLWPGGGSRERGQVNKGWNAALRRLCKKERSPSPCEMRAGGGAFEVGKMWERGKRCEWMTTRPPKVICCLDAAATFSAASKLFFGLIRLIQSHPIRCRCRADFRWG